MIFHYVIIRVGFEVIYKCVCVGVGEKNGSRFRPRKIPSRMSAVKYGFGEG